MRRRKDISVGSERWHWRRAAKLARAAIAALRSWSNSLACAPAAPRAWGEALEARQLLSFTVSVAAPQTVTAAQQFYIYAWTAGGTMTGDYTVNFGDSTGNHTFPYSTTSRVTAIPYTYADGYGGQSLSIVVSAEDTASYTACQSIGMDDLGNYPDTNGGPTTFVPSGADSATPSSIVVDPGTGYTFVAETYNTSGGGHQMALTRLDSNDLPDTQWGTHVSGSTYTGTLVVPAFGGGATGTDVAFGAAVGDFTVEDGGPTIDEIAIAGKSANGMAAAIIDLSGTGSVVGTSGYGGQTMPTGCAFAVTFDDSGDVILGGTDANQYNMVAVGLIGSGATAGELDTSFGPNLDGVTTFNFGGTTCTVARAIMQVPENGGNEELVLGGWCSAGCGACSTQCNLIVVGLTDQFGSYNRGTLDRYFGLPAGGGQYTGYNTVNVASVAATVGFNGCYGQSGCGVPSNDSVYSLVWEDDLNDVVAIGNTNYSAANQPVLWGVTETGQADTSSGSDGKGFGDLGSAGYGLAVPNVDVYSVTGAVANKEGSTRDGDIYIAGTVNGAGADLFLARYHVPDNDNGGGVYGLDPSFGTSFNGPDQGTGYFVQDLGSATGSSNDYGVGVAEENDESVVLLGSTNSPGGSTAVIRYNADSAITVQAADSPPPMSLAAVQAAAQPTTTVLSAPTITSDSTASDLSPPDSSGGQDPLHKRSARRPNIVLGAPPTVTTVSSP